ncbi:hypothetical protein [Aquabacter spiritensis]|uniref:Uncharacterized protein n=1 Tax=Aquabacter spiritensis TaxID=933073 RepID=A0A4R3LQS4_9HYPH|nr:hypothetical protein [Aquabacter spiritensis]TCT02914.1 hypothetical protein EDC64_11186 [Aquabacter spiritensis]
MKPASALLIGIAFGVVIAGPAFSQAGNDPRPPTAPGPALPEPAPGETLSDQLERHEGVIPPARNLDPELSHPAPATGTMPVIPPPGSPGGDPTIQPK